MEKSFLEQDRGALRLHRGVHVDYPKGRRYEDRSVIRILPGLGVAGFRVYPDHHDGNVLDPSRKAGEIDYRMGTGLLSLYDYSKRDEASRHHESLLDDEREDRRTDGPVGPPSLL